VAAEQTTENQWTSAGRKLDFTADGFSLQVLELKSRGCKPVLRRHVRSEHDNLCREKAWMAEYVARTKPSEGAVQHHWAKARAFEHPAGRYADSGQASNSAITLPNIDGTLST
jgi:hypothetical protein